MKKVFTFFLQQHLTKVWNTRRARLIYSVQFIEIPAGQYILVYLLDNSKLDGQIRGSAKNSLVLKQNNAFVDTLASNTSELNHAKDPRKIIYYAPLQRV
jgi:hypothetical protein